MNYRGKVLCFKKGKRIGHGGNGSVYEISCDPSLEKELVAKFLNNPHGSKFNLKKYERFKREVDAVSKLSTEVEGIIEIMDFNLPEKPTNENEPWFVMPKAKPSKEVILKKYLDIKVKIDIIRDIALILSKIHEKGYAHRDIKLDNLLFYNGKIVFSDFGLVSNTDYEQITKINESIGPWNTIAPEMKRHAYDIKDARPADVYSFAKIIWIILTEDEKCFDGQYEKDKSFGLKNSDFNIESLECIHELLKKSTDDDMYNRPNIEEVISLIDKWIHIISDKNKIRDEKRQIYRENIRKRYIPNEEIYIDSNEILDIIKDIFKLYSINGINFGEIYPKTCIKSKIVNCIEINDGKNIFIIKPVKLVVKNNDSNNFIYILETEDIEDNYINKMDDEYIRNENMSFIDNFLGRSFSIRNAKKIILSGEKDIRFKPY